MVLSKRERYIGIVALAAVLILALDYLVLTPLTQQRDDLDLQIAARQTEVDTAARLLHRRRDASAQWSAMLGGGLLHNASAAELQVQQSLNDWAQDAGLSQVSLKTERTEPGKDFDRITVRVTGAGNLRQISNFLWRIQTTGTPVRVTDLQLNARKEGTDDLSISLGVATIALIPDSEKASRTVQTASAWEAQP